MRTFSSSFLTALLIVALFLGNCFSCPQSLLAMQEGQSPHGCCHHHQNASHDCQTQALRQFVKANPASAPAPAVTALAAVPTAVVQAAAQPLAAPPPALSTDRLALHSILRV